MACSKCGKKSEVFDDLFGPNDFEYVCSECSPDPDPETDGPDYEGEPIEHSIYRPIPAATLELLNATNDPKHFGGECLGDDGQGNELWLFRSIEKLANRYTDKETGDFEWTDDIAGWNYDVDEFGLE
jgi:hypothetical protein